MVSCETANNFCTRAICDCIVESWFLGQAGNAVQTAASLALASNGYMHSSESLLLGAGFDSSSLDSYFDTVDYIGAMDAQTDWTAGWVKVGL